jgi:hypothetical protein
MSALALASESGGELCGHGGALEGFEAGGVLGLVLVPFAELLLEFVDHDLELVNLGMGGDRLRIRIRIRIRIGGRGHGWRPSTRC